MSIKDLTHAVKKDPIMSANILKVASSYFYDENELKTIEKAISKLGKTAIKAISLKDASKSLGEIDLTPYQINEKDFARVSMLRLSLMVQWYSKVSNIDLSVLSTTALLGNIGQILIAKEIMRIDKIDEFQELCNVFDINSAEEKLLHTSTAIVSSQILKFWRLPYDIVNVLAFSDIPEEAPKSLKHLIIANNIVYNLVDLRGDVSKEIPKNILTIMSTYGLDIYPLQNALNNINNL
jgi:HD-like signal output (HDOD) protein